MKSRIAVLFITSFIFATPSYAKISMEQRNAQIDTCMKKMAQFFVGSSKTDIDDRLIGQNNSQKCSLTVLYRREHPIFFLNMSTHVSDYLSSVELGFDDGSWPGIYNQIVKCDVTKSSIDVVNKYVMPRGAKIWSDGSLTTWGPLFNSVEKQTIQISKKADGSLKSATVRTKIGGKQTCNF